MKSGGERTEPPTERRLERARKEGHFPASREFVSAIQFLAFTALLASFSGVWFFRVLGTTRELLKRAFAARVVHADLTPQALIALVHELLLPILTPLVMGGGILLLAVLLAQLASTRLGLAPSRLIPDLKRLNPISRLKNLPGQNVPMLLQALVLLPVVALVVSSEISENLDRFLVLPWMSPQAGSSLVLATLKTLFWRVGLLFLVAGLVDLAWQRRRYARQLRMTKEEVRREAKEQQGNPEIKMRIRQLRRDLLRRRQMTKKWLK